MEQFRGTFEFAMENRGFATQLARTATGHYLDPVVETMWQGFSLAAQTLEIKERPKLVRLRDLEMYRTTDLGREKLCRRCGLYHPQDAEFFRWIPSRGHYYARCRPCEAADRRDRLATARIIEIKAGAGGNRQNQTPGYREAG